MYNVLLFSVGSYQLDCLPTDLLTSERFELYGVVVRLLNAEELVVGIRRVVVVTVVCVVEVAVHIEHSPPTKWACGMCESITLCSTSRDHTDLKPFPTNHSSSWWGSWLPRTRTQLPTNRDMNWLRFSLMPKITSRDESPSRPDG
jgi:hypothetical protein